MGRLTSVVCSFCVLAAVGAAENWPQPGPGSLFERLHPEVAIRHRAVVALQHDRAQRIARAEFSALKARFDELQCRQRQPVFLCGFGWDLPLSRRSRNARSQPFGAAYP